MTSFPSDSTQEIYTIGENFSQNQNQSQSEQIKAGSTIKSSLICGSQLFEPRAQAQKMLKVRKRAKIGQKQPENSFFAEKELNLLAMGAAIEQEESKEPMSGDMNLLETPNLIDQKENYQSKEPPQSLRNQPHFDEAAKFKCAACHLSFKFEREFKKHRNT